MASDKFQEIKEIPLTDLVIGIAQVRMRDVGKDIDELAASIESLGLLEPIVVCAAETEGKYEIILGQRRFLAHQRLKKPTILAAVLPDRVDETTAKVYSLTENLMRRDLNRKDLIDVCTSLYRKYDNMATVAEETGLPYRHVREYVKYDRLRPELRQLVDEGVDIKTALRAQDAASVAGAYDAEEAIRLAKEMSTMTNVVQKKVVQDREADPTKPVDDIIENAKAGGRIIQILVQLGAQAHVSLQHFAKDEDVNLDDAAADLITEGLSSKGYLDE